MIGDLGAPELLIILVVVVLLFGGGKVASLGKDLGASVREFRKAVRDDDAEAASTMAAPSAAPDPETPPMAAAAGAPAPEQRIF